MVTHCLHALVVIAVAAAFVNCTGIWQPAPGTTWFIELSPPIKSLSGISNFGAYDFDLFENPPSLISQIHKLPQGAKAICYFSAGTWENWRPDAHEFNKTDLGKPLAAWPGERWLNVSSPNVRSIMSARMDMAQRKGCDALDPDNVDGYTNPNGLGLTRADAINYVKWLTSEGHKRGMAVGLKNAGGIISVVGDNMQFSVNEQCVQYNECKVFQPFIASNKPVFHIEYQTGDKVSQKERTKVCDNKGAKGFSSVIKHLNLGKWFYYCPSNNTTPVKSAAARGPAPLKLFRRG